MTLMIYIRDKSKNFIGVTSKLSIWNIDTYHSSDGIE